MQVIFLMLLPDFQAIQKARFLVFLSFAFNTTCVHLLETLIHSNLNIWLSKFNGTICWLTVKCVIGNLAESGPYSDLQGKVVHRLIFTC